jgi:hypothetical protein
MSSAAWWASPRTWPTPFGRRPDRPRRI